MKADHTFHHTSGPFDLQSGGAPGFDPTLIKTTPHRNRAATPCKSRWLHLPTRRKNCHK